MAQYTIAQLTAAARQAGFRGNALTVAVAISLAENGNMNSSTVSGRNTNGTYDHGAFQINSSHTALLKTGDVNNLQDNANMAYALYKDAGNSFSPWSTYKSGAYAKHLTAAQQAVSGKDSTVSSIGNSALTAVDGIPVVGQVAQGIGALTGQSNPISDAVDVAKAPAELAAHLLDASLWKRIGIGALAVGIIVIGLIVMIGSNKDARDLAIKGAEVAAV